jgi:hypothetical protein
MTVVSSRQFSGVITALAAPAFITTASAARIVEVAVQHRRRNAVAKPTRHIGDLIGNPYQMNFL